jgi:uncharacterized hydrophobic protein (TIGR00341 family)
MALRLIEVLLPEGIENRLKEIIKDKTDLGVWQEYLSDNQVANHILVRSEKTEELLDLLESNFSTIEGFRVILLPVEATLPRPEQPAQPAAEETEAAGKKEEAERERISREELYQSIDESIRLSWVYVLLVILSSVVAAIGIERSNVAIIIGAMVIAPLLGPNVALSLAATLGDMKLALRALKANVAGIVVALVVAVLSGIFLRVTPDIADIASGTRVGLEDIVLALAAGSAGTLSFTTGLSTALIGVMVAVSLLPPLVTCGMLLGSGFGQEATSAFLLFFTNVVCINLSGVITFLIEGIQPKTWWEADRAKKATRNAIILWTAALLVLTILIILLKPK